MEIIGRLTADAEVKTVTDDKQVVNFDIAINDGYRTKEGEKREIVTYVQCAYWLSPKIAQHLKKGSVVSLFGRIGVNAYTNMQGEAKAALKFHVNNIQFISTPKGGQAQQTAQVSTDAGGGAPTPQTKDDLPF